MRHVAVDDCGRILNPLLVAGQQHGGVAQGIGAGAVGGDRLRRGREPADGDPRRLRHADAPPSCPRSRRANTETPTPLNPLGAKGIGESATVGSMPAVQNAVVDALSHLGVRHIDMPCTPERVWLAIRGGRRRSGPRPVAGAAGGFDVEPDSDDEPDVIEA